MYEEYIFIKRASVSREAECDLFIKSEYGNVQNLAAAVGPYNQTLAGIPGWAE